MLRRPSLLLFIFFLFQSLACLPLYRTQPETNPSLIKRIHDQYLKRHKGAYASPNIQYYRNHGYNMALPGYNIDEIPVEQRQYDAHRLSDNEHPSLFLPREKDGGVPRTLAARDGSWSFRVNSFGVYSIEPIFEDGSIVIIAYGHTNYGGPDFQRSYDHYVVLSKVNGKIVSQNRLYDGSHYLHLESEALYILLPAKMELLKLSLK